MLVVDTSSSMEDEKLRQAKAALKHTLGSLGPDDRFALISFATTPDLVPRRALGTDRQDDLRRPRLGRKSRSRRRNRHLRRARGRARLSDRKASGRTFQVVFLTDGLPTVGLTETSEILKILDRRDSRGIRIYTFGVGDDVDAHLLDLLAEKTRGCSTYVRPNEDLEAKVSAFSAKIGRPVRTDLELSISGGPHLVEMYPPRLPDLFQGEQLQVVGRLRRPRPRDPHAQRARRRREHFSESFRDGVSPRQPPITTSSPRSGPGARSAISSTRSA